MLLHWGKIIWITVMFKEKQPVTTWADATVYHTVYVWHLYKYMYSISGRLTRDICRCIWSNRDRFWLFLAQNLNPPQLKHFQIKKELQHCPTRKLLNIQHFKKSYFLAFDVESFKIFVILKCVGDFIQYFKQICHTQRGWRSRWSGWGHTNRGQRLIYTHLRETLRYSYTLLAK